MLFRYFFALGLVLSTTLSSAQIKEYNYRFSVKGVRENDTVYLANYFGKQLYYNDTAIAGKNGEFSFRKKRTIEPGQFAVVVPGSRYFELVISEPSFSIRTDTADFVKNMVVEGSPENSLFYEYIRYIASMKDRIAPVRERLNAAPEKEKEKVREEMANIDKQVKEYQRRLISTNPNLLTSQIIALSLDIEVPETPRNPDGTIDSTWAYYYYRDHYFDLVDLKNDGVVRTPAFHTKLDYFFSKIVLQHPDTICAVAERLTSRMDPLSDMLKYVVIHVTDTYNKSNIMGLADGVFVCMADKFYLSGKAYWADSALIAKFRDRADAQRDILIGKKAHALSLADTTRQNWLRLYDEKNDYTVLIFWDPDCGHCKKEMPLLAELYNKTGGKDFSVYAVSAEDGEKWKKFIAENKMNFTNVAVPSEVRSNQDLVVKLIREGKTDLKSLNHHDTFDVYSTPKLFLLDRNKTIVAKQIGVDQLEEILQQYREKDKAN